MQTPSQDATMSARHEATSEAQHSLELLALRDIRAAYQPDHTVLAVASLDICAGRVYAVVGPNGAGKTTLFNVLTLLLRPQQGRLLWHGQDVLATTKYSLQTLRRRVVLVAQQPLLFRTSVFNNVAYGLKMHGVPRRDIAPRVMAALQCVHMQEDAQRPARQLSGGETQRVALARALVLAPEVLLLDEPMTNLDAQSRHIVESVLGDLRQQRERTVLFTTHDNSQAYRLADEVIALHQGKLVTQPLANVLRGTLVQGQQETCFDTGRMRVVLPDQYRTASCIAIAPADILLSRLPLDSSARNNFPGRVVQVGELGTQLDVVVDVGERLHAHITRHSFQALDLSIGVQVYVTFKASAVHVYA